MKTKEKIKVSNRVTDLKNELVLSKNDIPYYIWKIVPRKLQIDIIAHLGSRVWIAGEEKRQHATLSKVHVAGEAEWPNGGATILIDGGPMKRFVELNQICLHPIIFKRKFKTSAPVAKPEKKIKLNKKKKHGQKKSTKSTRGRKTKAGSRSKSVSKSKTS